MIFQIAIGGLVAMTAGFCIFAVVLLVVSYRIRRVQLARDILLVSRVSAVCAILLAVFVVLLLSV